MKDYRKVLIIFYGYLSLAVLDTIAIIIFAYHSPGKFNDLTLGGKAGLIALIAFGIIWHIGLLKFMGSKRAKKYAKIYDEHQKQKKFLKDIEHASCKKCGVNLSKEKYCVLDKSSEIRKGKFKKGKGIYLCNNCLKDSLWEILLSFKHKAIVIYPSEDLNAYAFYNFNELEERLEKYATESYAAEEDLINDMKELLAPEKTKCKSCDNSAIFTWISSNVFNERNPYSWSVNREVEDYKFLCNKCLVKAIKDKIEQENIQIEALIPPRNVGEGFFTPWDY